MMMKIMLTMRITGEMITQMKIPSTVNTGTKTMISVSN